MLAYIVRRVLYAIPILVGVNLITFLLFFVVNTPDDMARMQLGTKRVTPEAIEKWKVDHGYDKPMTTIFYEKSVKLFVFDFGAAEDGRDIANEIATRMWPSLALAIPVFLVGLAVNITFAMLMAFFRATYLDFWGVVLCVAMMSISALFYIIGGQYVASKVWHLVPISGYDGGLDALKFLVLPALIGVVAGIGSGGRWYRTLFLEEMSRDYVRTARAKGLAEPKVLFNHVLRNALIPILTSAGSYLPFVFLGSLVFESFFGIPGLGSYVIEAITGQDFAIVRSMVFVGSLLYIASYIVIDVAYTWVDPRVRLA
jgi:peptide/nickel transport system permease protein